ncbi:hypothetical protein Cgig2_016351 [Carnegiea gigantea]|uniref:Protein N-terminal asparagine amidohydrolase n=1 Tax=Carnegiea gigantea TaxID=171969 RepID=A0A9Q1JVP0_9CARY|nr:hypothetical protein Cgig2_016351 [Carnegiea gigantea]
MIYVGGVPFDRSYTNVGTCDLTALMEHPALVSASLSFKAIPERKFSASEASSDGLTKGKHVYLFQREYATVDPAFVDLIGTDEATTCVGIVLRNRDNGMTSLAHMDSPKIVDIGLSQMLSKLVDHKLEAELERTDDSTGSESNSETDGHSFPLCAKIIDSLGHSPVKFHIQTLFVLGHNTRRDPEGNVLPIFTGLMGRDRSGENDWYCGVPLKAVLICSSLQEGFLCLDEGVETLTGKVTPARFDETTRCPDEMVRRIRVSASFEDPRWRGKLLDTYDTETDRFIIAPCSWNVRLVHMASVLQKLSDSDILHTHSTSPYAEAPDFVVNQRRYGLYTG